MRGKEQRNLWWFWFDDSAKQREAIINIFSDEMKKLAYKIFSPQWLLYQKLIRGSTPYGFLPIFNSTFNIM